MTTFYDFENKKKEYSLTVSQFAKLCNTTRDTLRHYYEQKIIVPWVDPANGYHYYSASQISSFFFISTMRQAGCSIKEISSIIHDQTKDGIVHMVNSKILDMQRELYLINKKISALQLGMWILEKFESHRPGVPFLDDLPPMSITATPVKDKSSAYHVADIASDISTHLVKTFADQTLTSFPSGVTISYEDFVNKKYVYNNVISISFLPADNVGTHPIPGSRAVMCHHNQLSPDIEKTYKKMLSYIKKNRLKACSDLYSISLINLYDKEENHTYFKYLFICVEQDYTE